MPHGSCFLWDPWLTSLHVVGDSFVLVAYFSIPLLLLLNRQHIVSQIRPVVLLFAAFIFSCGIGHGIRVWNIWHADYWLEGGWSWITATISLYTAWQLKGLVPQMLSTQKDLIATRALVEQDPLTGIANRRGLEASLATLSHQPEIAHTLVLIDLDGFKDINDTYGHLAGDQVLRTVAEILRGHIRAVDLAARIGGDEFALLLAGCTPPEARLKLELIRQQIADVHLPDLPVSSACPLVSASIGISELSLDRGLVHSYQQADTALYRAKKGGKNQVQVAPVSPAVAE